MATVTETWPSLTSAASRWGVAEWAPHADIGELQTHTRGGITVAGGVLTLTARRQVGGWTAPRVTSFALVPPVGTLTVRASLPRVQGIRPAVWLLGDGEWPDGGEIDLAEIVNAPVSDEDPRPLLHGNMHGGKVADGIHWQAPARTWFTPDTWVTLGLVMRSSSITLTVDGRTVHTWDKATIGHPWPVPAQGMRLVLSIHVGGWGGLPDPDGPTSVSMKVGRITWQSA